MRADSTKEIASDLGITTNTVKSHLANLYLKLGVNSISALLRVASRNYAEHSPDCDCVFCELMRLEVPAYCRCLHCTAVRGG